MLSHDMLIPLAVFVSITLGTWVALGVIAGRPRTCRGAAAAAARPAAPTGTPSRPALAQPAGDVPGEGHGGGRASWASRSARRTRHELGKVRLKLLNAGFRQEQAVAVFYGIKLIGLLVGLAVAVPRPVLHVRHDADRPLSMAVAAAALGFYLPGFPRRADGRRSGRSRSSWACPTRWT